MVSPHTDRQARARRLNRHRRLRRLGYTNYAEYLRSPAWSDVKRRYRASDLPQVCVCGETTVQLHHKTYERVGEEALTDLAPLCGDCHRLVHVLERRGELLLDLTGLCSDERAAAYAIVAERRAARAAGEYTDQHRERQIRRNARSFAQHLRTSIEDANREGVDISAPLADLHATIARIDAHRRQLTAS